MVAPNAGVDRIGANLHLRIIRTSTTLCRQGPGHRPVGVEDVCEMQFGCEPGPSAVYFRHDPRLSPHRPRVRSAISNDRTRGRARRFALQKSRRGSYKAVAVGAGASGAMAIGTMAIGALAVGAVAIGALAIGRLAIKRLSVRKSQIDRLEIDELVVRRLQVEEVVMAKRNQIRDEPPDRA